MKCVCCSVTTMGQLVQFRLLLWKNYLLQRRKVLVTCLEIGIPTVFALILILVRQRVECNRIADPTTWNEFAVNARLGRFDWMSEGPWQIYFTPNSTSARLVMESTAKQLNQSCAEHSCLSGQCSVDEVSYSHIPLEK